MNKLLSTTALVLTLAFTGMAYADDDTHEGHHHHDAFMEEGLAKLPQKDADQFRENTNKANEKNKDLEAKAIKAHQELKTLLTAEKFDKAAFLAKYNEMKKLRTQIESNREEAFATAAGNLSQDERKTLLAAAHEHHKDHWHKDHAKDGDTAPTPAPTDDSK